jgi:hypothetical protein
VVHEYQSSGKIFVLLSRQIMTLLQCLVKRPMVKKLSGLTYLGERVCLPLTAGCNMKVVAKVAWGGLQE